ncbi:MAG: hypothetical protein F4Y50_12060 [Dehalococcoidia bacterium]|nr:hypothetical protein [Dehalococcoidia bacterium]
MNQSFRFSLKVDFDAPGPPQLPQLSITDFEYMDQLLESLRQLLDDTAWPESIQGEFLEYAALDVYEFGCAIRAEAAAGRWTVAASLMRPLQERAEYTFAAAIDPGFYDKYVEYMDTQIEKEFTAKSRNLVETARGIINRWGKESEGIDGYVSISRSLNKIGSEALHHAVGFSREAAEIAETRPGILKMLTGRIQGALANVLAATQVIEQNHTKAWAQAYSVVFLSRG